MMVNNNNVIVKTPTQIAGIRKSSVLAADALQYAGEQIQAGMTSLELNDLVHNYIVERGGIPATLGYPGSVSRYPKSCCISINEVVCHGIPDNRKFVEGDVVKVDIATILDTWFGDNCATFAIGEVSPEAKKLIRVTQECLEKGIAAVKPYKHLNEIGKAITKHARSNGCSVVFEYAGHGVGCQFHEHPNVSHAELRVLGPKMLPGWVFTIEPMINLGVPNTLLNEADGWTVRTADGKLSAQFEHTILVTEAGYEILTIPTKIEAKHACEGQS